MIDLSVGRLYRLCHMRPVAEHEPPHHPQFPVAECLALLPFLFFFSVQSIQLTTYLQPCLELKSVSCDTVSGWAADTKRHRPWS